MITELTKAIVEAMKFRNIDPEAISKIEANVGFIWFKSGDRTYFVGIQQADFDLDEYSDEQAR